MSAEDRPSRASALLSPLRFRAFLVFLPGALFFMDACGPGLSERYSSHSFARGAAMALMCASISLFRYASERDARSRSGATLRSTEWCWSYADSFTLALAAHAMAALALGRAASNVVVHVMMLAAWGVELLRATRDHAVVPSRGLPSESRQNARRATVPEDSERKNVEAPEEEQWSLDPLDRICVADRRGVAQVFGVRPGVRASSAGLTPETFASSASRTSHEALRRADTFRVSMGGCLAGLDLARAAWPIVTSACHALAGWRLGQEDSWEMCGVLAAGYTLIVLGSSASTYFALERVVDEDRSRGELAVWMFEVARSPRTSVMALVAAVTLFAATAFAWWVGAHLGEPSDAKMGALLCVALLAVSLSRSAAELIVRRALRAVARVALKDGQLVVERPMAFDFSSLSADGATLTMDQGAGEIRASKGWRLRGGLLWSSRAWRALGEQLDVVRGGVYR